MLFNSTEARFWSKVNIKRPDSCWEWQGGKRGKGYGSFWLNGHHVAAHRVAWELSNTGASSDLFVLHKCDNRLCCNPNHLFLGTHQDNMVDMKIKGRQGGWKERIGSSPRTKMTPDIIQEIRKSRGKYSQRKLAKMYNMSQAGIWKIQNSCF